MLDSGSFWLITHAELPTFDNTPFTLWLTVLSFSVFGVSSYSAIVPSALFATGIVFMTYRLSLLLYKDCWIAFASAFVLLFPGMFVDAARRAMTDIPLTFFVTLTFYAFFKARDQKLWYLVFGLALACSILTKSVLGLFPLAIVGAFLILSRQWREIINPWFLSGSLIGLILGFSWHFINWQTHGQGFISEHFGWLIFERSFGGTKDPFYFLGYAKDFLKNYWPWLPFALVGLVQFGKNSFKGKNETALLLFLWPVLTFLVMSTIKNQVLRYLFMIFPALAIITARTISAWMGTERKNQALVIIAGVIVATTLFVNATPFQAKVTLGQSTKEIRELAAVINLSTPENQRIGNYRLALSNPRLAMLFYSNRVMEGSISDNPEKLMTAISSNPEKTWLTSTRDFRKLVGQYPNTIYLIQANNKYSFFTSIKNRKNIRYDFSEMRLPIVK